MSNSQVDVATRLVEAVSAGIDGTRRRVRVAAKRGTINLAGGPA